MILEDLDASLPLGQSQDVGYFFSYAYSEPLVLRNRLRMLPRISMESGGRRPISSA